MKFRSTRGAAPVCLVDALLSGIAGDGGLLVPTALPKFSARDFDGAGSVGDIAHRLLAPFFDGSRLAGDLDAIVQETFRFPIPLRPLPADTGSLAILELFHGPTAAFKDVGAGFLAACLTRLERGRARPLTVLVATSGDTGGAVAAAFDGRAGIQVAVLFPEGRVSARQAQQLTCWGDNVLSLAVGGAFDDCQALVKSAMADVSLKDEFRFTSANSINVGRLLPQCCYYAATGLEHWRQHGRKPGFIVPTGNLGNALACVMAREMGLPIGEIVLATNANRIIVDYFKGSPWQPRDSVATLASAMDVGNPSNMERLRDLLGDGAAISATLRAYAATDDDIKRQIKRMYDEYWLPVCPHTATACHTYEQLGAKERQENDWIIIGTAHPAKFETIVEPLIGSKIALPESLKAIHSKPSRFVPIDADLSSLEAALRDRFRQKVNRDDG